MNLNFALIATLFKNLGYKNFKVLLIRNIKKFKLKIFNAV